MSDLDSLRNFLITIEHFVDQKTIFTDQPPGGTVAVEADQGLSENIAEEDELLAEMDNLFQSASLEELQAMRQRICLAGLNHIDNALEQLGQK